MEGWVNSRQATSSVEYSLHARGSTFCRVAISATNTISLTVTSNCHSPPLPCSPTPVSLPRPTSIFSETSMPYLPLQSAIRKLWQNAINSEVYSAVDLIQLRRQTKPKYVVGCAISTTHPFYDQRRLSQPSLERSAVLAALREHRNKRMLGTIRTKPHEKHPTNAGVCCQQTLT